ncbi:uncharacterized protein F4807DRAFT_410181 [Annulohypoxylon truncatum]|uniref:uncharacterized protein n=1 Tax=Annulohypoxylon truncatum TaxID=327061 RepID=UPI0020082272|nr:uncharacterized protein F4807DRAFT_410181 [Annulohypoxylon truncatum]KAI1213221.1 hypothetical protein F4807DRAFT_410181 [Annulohypoxylon truncatum]
MASSSGYVPILPSDSAVNERIKSFMEKFYAISDDPSKNEEWVDYFLPDAVVIIGDRSAKGTDEIRQLRQGMWERTKSRRHKPGKVFPATFGGADEGEGMTIEYMLQGSVDFVLKNGEQKAVSWAGHAVLNDAQGRLKYQFYQVYLRG